MIKPRMNTSDRTMIQTKKYYAARMLGLTALTVIMIGCASGPVPRMERNPDVDALPPAQPQDEGGVVQPLPDGDGKANESSKSGARIQPGTGRVINEQVAASAPPRLPSEGEATFNFEGESLHAVVKAVLGDLLQQNYVIAPGVQGTVTLATPKPVGSAQALSLLEMVLAWNNARLVWTDGRYNIVPSDQAVAGNLSPRTGGAANARGFELRAIPLKYISASEMEKLIEPYARKGAIVQVDPARNLIVLGGTRSELESYQRTVQIFDVDWLAGMSVGVFPLQSAEADKVVSSLEQVFGAESNTPLAGMFRFLPIEGTNSVIVITPQAKYLRDAEDWIEKLDAGGEGSRLYVYDVKYMKATDLASQLSQVFGGGGGGGASTGGDASIQPGLTPVDLESVTRAPAEVSQPESSPSNGGSAASGDGLSVGGGDVSISAVEENNSLLIRSAPAQWESIRRAIDKLDQVPAQVHIEAQVVEVALNEKLDYGVSWFFRNSITDAAIRQLSEVRGGFASLFGGSVNTAGNTAASFVGDNTQAILGALDSVSSTRILSTPSITVRNNVEAELNVGENIPVVSTSLGQNPGTPNNPNVFSQVQYLQTGTKLTVKPRIASDGSVFMEISQTISSRGDLPPGAPPGSNPPINTRELKTEAVVKDGETIFLAGLISEGKIKGTSGVPGLNRIPVVGGLFGNKTNEKNRSEVLILLTPRVIRSPLEARKLTDEYGERFKGLEPLRKQQAKQARDN